MDSSSASQRSPFRSRRSYPSLKQISLTPLAPQFPVDDDNADKGSGGLDANNNDRHRKSYLSSSSVPGTPSLLSHSRSTSRTRRHTRSKSSSGDRRLSRTSTNTDLPQASQQRHSIGGEKKELVDQHHHQHHHNQDPEWLLRTGIALASSTREEKGQSWLAKRESSTSLVSDDDEDAALLPKYHHHHHHYHNYHHGHQDNHQLRFDRKSMRSGKSTPGAYSRYASRRGSRADMAMTPSGGGDVAEGAAHFNPRRSQSGIASPASIGSFPDFIDERIRAEMDSLRRDIDTHGHISSSVYSSPSSPSASFSSSDESESDSEDEIDEQEMQRLTRERGFGFGGWLDRLVEWTLFSVHDGPSPHGGGGGGIQQRDAVALTVPAYGDDGTLKDPLEGSGSDLWATALKTQPGDDDGDDGNSDGNESLAEHDRENHNGDDSLSTIVEKPGEEGGWEDVGWLFNVVRSALF